MQNQGFVHGERHSALYTLLQTPKIFSIAEVTTLPVKKLSIYPNIAYKE